MIYDMVIVGGGPAGLSAAMWAARYRRSALVIDDGEQRNRWADVSHGLLTRDAADPLQLLRDGREELRRYPTVDFCEGQATHVSRDTRERFVVRVRDDEVVGLRLILATGVVDRFPVIDGFFEHYGASVFHCATCDGYDARGHSVVILGWGEHVAAFAIGLLEWARTITVVTEGHPLDGGPDHRTLLPRHGIRVIEGDASALLGRRGSLEGVRLRSGDVIDAGYVFFSIAHHPRLSLAEQLGCEVSDEGCLIVDRDGRTSIDGCFAAGDITPGFQLVPVAVGKGAAAGVASAMSLRGEPGAPITPTPAPDPEAELAQLSENERPCHQRIRR